MPAYARPSTSSETRTTAAKRSGDEAFNEDKPPAKQARFVFPHVLFSFLNKIGIFVGLSLSHIVLGTKITNGIHDITINLYNILKSKPLFVHRMISEIERNQNCGEKYGCD